MIKVKESGGGRKKGIRFGKYVEERKGSIGDSSGVVE